MNGTNKKTLGHRIWKYRWFYLLLLPGLLFFIIYKYVPMWGILMAFQDFRAVKGILGSEWVGLKHFVTFFSQDRFTMLLRNTLTISLSSLIFGFPAPIILALMLNEVRHSKFKKTVQTLIYLPHFLSATVIWALVFVLFSKADGILNHVIAALGGAELNILMNEKTYYPLFIGTGIWQGAGWGTIIYLAALSGVDVQLYESAMLDGAGRWKQMWYITLPSLLPVIMVTLVLQVGDILDVAVDKTLLFSNAMNRPVAETFDSHVYNRGILSGEYSYSTAVGLWKSAVGMILVLSANRLSKLVTDEAIY